MMRERVTTREHIELHLLTSLARSQRALSRIVESVADQAAASDRIAKEIAGHLEALCRYQGAMITKFIGKRPVRRRSAFPAPPWLNPLSGVAASRQFPRK
ncbi:hypothetical protein B5M42_004515 [Paenibacillus athensensis]|uniref:Uncharacterized protein n=1 Tax=Paenibacillus athensensis TaxID=1967502 RepID=A0A4Y8PRI2_9BACL|nr:hypothetical protein [Paenibacillus athensensis]MCD1258102.1 hypothetical protein [Paenibacillus athensensis]